MQSPEPSPPDNPCAEEIIDLYERHARRWAELRSTHLFEQPWLDTFLARVRPDGHILDIGCGNGTPVAAYFIRRGYRVTGIDASPTMIARFAAHARPHAPLMFTSGTHDGEAIGRFEGDELYHASLAPEAYRLLLETHGFELLKHVVNDPCCGGRTVWLAVKNA
ncbi:class I SAM-dependent DNA methyltransferase [Raoultella sp. FYR_9]|uniref:class I SAM-dependent DNA methyltransferase n=1 Tax=Raoultella sp. FYR_9 TaxID=3367176 RepID=UPI003709D304